MIAGLVEERDAPPNRQGAAEGGREKHLSEAAVMAAFALHLFDAHAVKQIKICPDGEHCKRFDIRAFLETQGFSRARSIGSTRYGGEYVSSRRTLSVTLTPGVGDVIAQLEDGTTIVAECKGGILNTRHPGQLSRLRKGLFEAVGILLVRPTNERQVAVVPKTNETVKVARRLIARAHSAGIEIALVDGSGGVEFVGQP